jgi:hypothetical protein
MDPHTWLAPGVFEPSPQPRILPPCPTISAVARLDASSRGIVKRCWKIWQPSARINQSQPTIDTAYHCMFPRPLRLEGCRILGEGYPCQPGAFQIHGARMARQATLCARTLCTLKQSPWSRYVLLLCGAYCVYLCYVLVPPIVFCTVQQCNASEITPLQVTCCGYDR